MPSPRHPQPPADDTEPPPADLAEQLVPIAAELVGSVHDYGPDTVHQILERIPTHRHGALAVVLAAMVDPDRTPAELLAWLDQPQSRPFEPQLHWPTVLHPGQRPPASTSHSPDLIADRRAEIDRLTRLGLSSQDIAIRLRLNPRTVNRHRATSRREVA